ncbi:MAG: hypothetical protein AB7S36_23245 [Planctomycetota bacterium]
MSDPATTTTATAAAAFIWPAPLAVIDREQLKSIARERGVGPSCALAIMLRNEGHDVAAWADSERELMHVEVHFHRQESIEQAKAAGVRVIGAGVLDSIGAAADAGVPAIGVGDLQQAGVVSVPVGAVRSLASNRLDVPDHAVPVFVLSSRGAEVARLVGDVRLDFHKAVPEWSGGGSTDDDHATDVAITNGDAGEVKAADIEPRDRAEAAGNTARAIAHAQSEHADIGRREADLVAQSALVSSYGDNVAEVQQVANKVCSDLRVLFFAMRRQRPEDIRAVLMRVNCARGSLELFATVLRQTADAVGVYDQQAAAELENMAGDALALGKRLDLIVKREVPLPAPVPVNNDDAGESKAG